jgi:hypothetical protein
LIDGIKLFEKTSWIILWLVQFFFFLQMEIGLKLWILHSFHYFGRKRNKCFVLPLFFLCWCDSRFPCISCADLMLKKQKQTFSISVCLVTWCLTWDCWWCPLKLKIKKKKLGCCPHGPVRWSITAGHLESLVKKKKTKPNNFGS